MSQRKAWTKQEDQLLTKIMKDNQGGDSGKKWRWNQIGDKISEQCINSRRTGKQCRQRWFNQLHPQINKESQWSKQEEEALFRLQAEVGNKWAKIANHIPGRSDNNIKNYFYSTLRKAIRRVNNYVAFHKRSVAYKNLKAFQSNTLNKILTVAQNRADKKIIVGKQSASSLAKDIRDLLILIQTKYSQKQINHQTNIMDALISKIQEFNKICKRRKAKKRDISSQQKSAPSNQQHSPSFPNQIQSQFQLLQSQVYLSQNHLQIQAAKNKSEILPLQKQQGSQSYSLKQKQLRIKQRESQVVGDNEKIVEPLFSSFQDYNSNSPFFQPYKSLQKTQESQCLQSNSMHYEPSFPHQAPNLGFVPFVHHNIFTGSAFIPTPLFSPPFMSFPQPSSFPNQFQMSRSQQYSLFNHVQINPLLRKSLNILQVKKEFSESQ